MALPSVASLRQQFALDSISFYEPAPDFPAVRVENRLGRAEIAIQGAQVMTYRPAGQEPVIWLSTDAKFKPGKSIRGGVPVCWPWFGPHDEDAAKPGHGYARTVPWGLRQAVELDNGATQLTFTLEESDATRAMWPQATPVELQITVGESLRLELTTKNMGSEPVVLGEALHTYFVISDIAKIAVQGLEGASFYDKVDGMARKVQKGPVTVGAEVDRVYVDTNADCWIHDPGLKRRIRVHAPAANSTIVWNPWQEKADQMGDLGETGYQGMICVESGNALDNRVTLPAGKSHAMMVKYSVEAL